MGTDVTQIMEQTGYRLVQENVRQRILTGEWAAGAKIPSERELEKDLQISRLTVSKGLSHLVAEGLLVRRRGLGTYVSDPSGGVATGRKLVKFISPVGRDEGRPSVRHGILEGMYEALASQGFHVGVDFYRRAIEQVYRLKQDSDPSHAGFVIWYEAGNENLDELMRLRKDGYPFVLVDAHPMDLAADHTATDNGHGGRAVVEYLADLGHKRIGYVSRATHRSSLRDRQAGFLQGLLGRGLPFDSSSVVTLKGWGEEALLEVPAAIDAFLTLPNRPTALFFCNDDLAFAAMDYLQSRGVRVPEDMSIVGFDDVDRAAYNTIPLTTVHQDFFEMGKASAEILLRRLTGHAEGRPMQVLVRPRLVERLSSGPAPRR